MWEKGKQITDCLEAYRKRFPYTTQLPRQHFWKLWFCKASSYHHRTVRDFKRRFFVVKMRNTLKYSSEPKHVIEHHVVFDRFVSSKDFTPPFLTWVRKALIIFKHNGDLVSLEWAEFMLRPGSYRLATINSGNSELHQEPSIGTAGFMEEQEGDREGRHYLAAETTLK